MRVAHLDASDEPRNQPAESDRQHRLDDEHPEHEEHENEHPGGVQLRDREAQQGCRATSRTELSGADARDQADQNNAEHIEDADERSERDECKEDCALASRHEAQRQSGGL